MARAAEFLVSKEKELDIKPHMVYLSLGIHGNTSLLPDGKVLEITTMCGQGKMSSRLKQCGDKN